MFYYPILLQDKEKLKWYMAEATHSLLFFMSSSSVFDYMARRRFTLFNSSVIIIVIYLPSSLLLCDTSPSTTFFIFLLTLIWSICKIYEICFCCFYWFFSLLFHEQPVLMHIQTYCYAPHGNSFLWSHFMLL